MRASPLLGIVILGRRMLSSETPILSSRACTTTTSRKTKLRKNKPFAPLAVYYQSLEEMNIHFGFTLLLMSF